MLYGLVELAKTHIVNPAAHDLVHQTVRFLEWINLVWGFMNLLPIWPLDGGQIARELLKWLLPESGIRVSLVISILTAGLLAANVLCVHFRGQALPLLDQIPYLNNIDGIYTAIFLGTFVYHSFQILQIESQRPPWERWD